MNVAYRIASKDTLKREVSSLGEGMNALGVKESFLLVAEDKEEAIEVGRGRKIFVLTLWKWLF